MRKLLLLVVLLLGAAISVSAIDETELSALARYVPEETFVYAAIRTDDEFITAVNALLNKGLPFFPPDEVPADLDLLALLDAGLASEDLGSFEESIRPWLGNTAALALFASEDFAEEPDGLVLLEADGQAAYEFLQPLLEESGDYEATEINNMQAFESTDDDNPATIAFGEDAIFISNNAALIPAGEASPALSENSQFNDVLRKLPAEEYASIIYINNAELQRLNLAQSGMEVSPLLEDFLNLSPAVAVGFTMLNDEALVMDMAQVIDTTAFADAGIRYADPSALDFAFANHIPADAVAVLQGTDFGAGLQLSFDNLRALGEYIKNNGGLADLIDPTGASFESEEQRHAVNQFDLAWLIGALNLSFSGATGLSLENDVLPVLDGNAAAYLRVLPAEGFLFPVLPDGAILFQTSNSEGAEAIVTQLGNAATAYELPNSSEDFGNGTALVLSAEDSIDMEYAALDILVGASDDVIALGTRNAVEASLNTSGGLADDANFQTAQQYLLSESQSLAYLAPTPLFDAIDPLIEDGTVPLDEDSANAYRLFSLVETATISSVVQSDGTSLVRFVISLADAPRPVPQSPDA